MRIFTTMRTLSITVRGLVQGVGFRPFVYRIARLYGLTGWVRNTSQDVRIQVTGEPAQLDLLLHALRNDAPSASIVEEVLVEHIPLLDFPDFVILKSESLSEQVTDISPDIAVCDECLEDMDQPGSRKDYPFVNCTRCGPRFTIIRDLPYDRAMTTMQPFPMCEECHREYDTVTDRRFHAQPVACRNCGPHYSLYEGGKLITEDISYILPRIASILQEGGIVAIKGLGGMHLACNPLDDNAVGRLREIKSREAKPFAVMCRDLATLKEYAYVSEKEEVSLSSWRRPIVLLEKKEKFTGDRVTAGLTTLGVMLPYMPFHYLLFRHLGIPFIVMTSGNFRDEPILIYNQDALDQFSSRVQAIVLHNRDIHNRTDDSVVRVAAEKEQVLRRSRGYVPATISTGLDTEGIIAFGAELTNCFCVGKGSKAILSQHIGDLQGFETTRFFEESLSRFLTLFRLRPALLVTDMHPDYIATQVARTFRDVPMIRVQHHHAHAASCMAEHGLDEPVIAVVFDGTGYGTDGNTWGAEFLVCDLAGFSRAAHFDYVPLPGGDKAVQEPWRTALSWIYKAFGESFDRLQLPFLENIDREKRDGVIKMIREGINCPHASSAGRLFDAVASMTGLCLFSRFQAEGPMLLESMVDKDIRETYSWLPTNPVNLNSFVRGIAGDVLAGTSIPRISSKFHNTLVTIIFETVKSVSIKEKKRKVVLSGGVFQNKYLLEESVAVLSREGYEVYTHSSVPANDGGIALGQLAIAAKRREMRCV